MIKGLEALDNLFGLVAFQESFEKAQKYFDIIEEELQRLEAIDNAKPSEVLECLERIDDYVDKDYDYCQRGEYKKDYNTIKQALIKAEHDKKLLKIYEQENENQFNNIVDKEKKALAFDIIKEKRVDVEKIYFYRNLEDYNSSNVYALLTQEEFDLLKEVLG